MRRRRSGIAGEPRVGLLSIGAGASARATSADPAVLYELLDSDPPHGAPADQFHQERVEGVGTCSAGKVDVIVTDGFTGNVARSRRWREPPGSRRPSCGRPSAAPAPCAVGTLLPAPRPAGTGRAAGFRDLRRRLRLLGLEATVVIAHGAVPTARGAAAAASHARRQLPLPAGRSPRRIRERLGPAPARFPALGLVTSRGPGHASGRVSI